MSTSEAVAERRVTPARVALAGGVAIAGLLLTGMAVFAGLNAVATNTAAHTITSGTLELTYADNGAGFTQQVNDMAPGDTVNRFVTLTNGGTLDGKTLTLAAAASPANKLSDPTNGLQVSITSCDVAWVASTGSCTSNPTPVASGSLASMGTTALSLASNVAHGAVMYYEVSVTLPNQSETVTNGALPANTIQGLSTGITWAFNELQRTATNTSA